MDHCREKMEWGLILFVVNIDVSVAVSADGNVAAAVRIFLLVVVGGARTIVAKARDVASHLRPPAAADQHQERLAATGALFLRLTCNQTGKRISNRLVTSAVPIFSLANKFINRNKIETNGFSLSQ